MPELAQKPDLARKRCFNHAAREAAARCPRCQRFFCRECVTEHAGRVICAACLSKLAGPARVRFAVPRALVGYSAGLAGLIVAWMAFYYLGRVLLSLPTSFHDGTLWLK